MAYMLVSENEPRQSGYRIAQVAATQEDVFEVAPPLFWQECSSDVIADVFFYNTTTQQAERVPVFVPSADQNKQTALDLLNRTDWVNQPDVYDPANTPHLLNRSEFLEYRATVRVVAVSPTDGDLNWPPEPTAVWSV